LDDYAFTIESLIALYEATFEENWLSKAKSMTDQAITLFYDPAQATFYYTSEAAGEKLITRKSEIMDNVIPASSSCMVRNLYRLATLFDQEDYLAIADQVFANVFPQIKQYGSAYSNWAIQLLEHVYGTNEIALTGAHANAWREELDRQYIPNKITIGGTKSSLPLLMDKEGLESKAYLCRNKTCSLPQKSVVDLLQLLNDNRDSSQIN
jgi:uncharacterized protein